ncbi:hypothetical protein HDR58_06420 [bacterium]|nr:hypothetical protein [bacterium]
MNNIGYNKYTYTPSFQASYKSPFGKRFEKALVSGDISEDIVKDFASILETKKNIISKIGNGRWGEVFRIDDYFVFKTYYDHPPAVGKAKINTDSTFDVLKTYCGKVLARIGNIEIIRNVTKNKKNFLEMAKYNAVGERAYDYTLKEFCSLPQKAFDDLAQDFKTLNGLRRSNIFYRFDTANPNNFIKVGKSIKVVDDIDWTPCPEANDIYAYLRVFIQEGGDLSLKKEIFKKCILAIEKHQLPLEAAHKYIKQQVQELFSNAGVRVSFDDYYKDMTALRSTCSEDAVRMTKVNEYLENL